MKYIFCGNMFANIETDIMKMNVPPPVSSHKYQENLIRGLLANKQDVYVVNIPRVRYFPFFPQIIFKKNTFRNPTGVKGINIGFINLPLLNYVSQRISLRKELCNLTRKDTNFTLISFNNYLPQNQAMVDTRNRRSNVLICNVLGDIHGGFGVRIASRYEGLKGKIIEKVESKQDYLSTKSDAFGFLTKFMAEALGVQRKPYVVVEGIYSGDKRKVKNMDSKEKIIFYAGAVEEEYDIIHLLRAFSMIKDQNFRLKIAGVGGAVEEVKKYSELDPRVSYLGYLTPEDVERKQRDATCLVNPRTSSHKYVKYAFPSKNMECLASGKPYVAHDLPCNPPEYIKYLQCPEDESDEALSKELVRVCLLPAEDRQRIGIKAQNFIITQKNPQMQCKKIVEMMNDFDQ